MLSDTVKINFQEDRFILIRLGTDLVGNRFHLNAKPLSDSIYWEKMKPAYDDGDRIWQDQLAVWEIGKKKIQQEDVQVMHAVTEIVDVNVDVADKYYGIQG